MYPERYRTRGFPTDAEIEAISLIDIPMS